jgi:hypothetical protein
MEAEAVQWATAPASNNLGVFRSNVIRNAPAMLLGSAQRPTVGGSPPDDEAVIPDLDADEPRPVGHLLCNRHDPTQPEFDA